MKQSYVRESVRVESLGRPTISFGNNVQGWCYFDDTDLYEEYPPPPIIELVVWAGGTHAEKCVKKLLKKAKAWYARQKKE